MTFKHCVDVTFVLGNKLCQGLIHVTEYSCYCQLIHWVFSCVLAVGWAETRESKDTLPGVVGKFLGEVEKNWSYEAWYVF